MRVYTRKDLTGKVFGNWTVLKWASTDKNYNIQWECQCSCGKIKNVQGNGLTGGKTKSCGCLIQHNLLGQRFGKLLVLRKSTERRNDSYMWECLCDCGKKLFVRTKSLVHADTRSCGCSTAEFIGKANTKHGQCSPGNVSPEYRLYIAAKVRAKKNRVPFNISWEDVHIPEKCPLLGITLARGMGQQVQSSPSIDRIDPTKGYVKGNIWVISYRANAIKRDATIEEFKTILSAWEKVLN